MLIKTLFISHGKGTKPEQLNKTELVEGIGMKDEPHQNSERQLSLIGASALDQVEQMGKRGLCMHRYYANIVIDGLEGGMLKKGDVLRIGQARVQITQVGKRCFDECVQVQEGTSADCPLHTCLFAKVLSGGTVNAGDLVQQE
ncbi:hypothetical protein LJC42_02680 [Eubacteriales bacterium OttesenSCG-928-K08]|nr:hypothetical protein [Eubacteriales bacterium OttesenSCG-928-K08]